MVETINERIDRFVSYFEGQLEEISQLGGQGDHVHHYQRVLYVTVLDALAKVLLPTTGSNRPQMVNLLSNFSEWKEYDRISLPHLIQLLKLEPKPIFDQLRAYAMEQYSKWTSGEIITLDRDLAYQDVLSLWPHNNEYPYTIKYNNKDITPDSLQHVRLFYYHRNSLVHEFRMLGRLSREPTFYREEPYYSALILEVDETGAEVTTWELQYPLVFYKRIAKNCLTNLPTYLTRNRIDPISVFRSGSYWINELNT
jgi:hypothetical protein